MAAITKGPVHDRLIGDITPRSDIGRIERVRVHDRLANARILGGLLGHIHQAGYRSATNTACSATHATGDVTGVTAVTLLEALL
ncbi:MAG: hypothetical protein VW806_14420 [Halieaceae bacterium]